ncbi:MAG: glycosyltransferase family 1 protein [Bryobacteraceae bacterium]|nr:glycosyltransferase family 1 protein [Bryobacteraceae bacterium]
MPLHIAIDVRHYRDFGIGTYIRNLVAALGRVDRENHYVLVGNPTDAESFQNVPPNFHAVYYQRSDRVLIDNVAFPLFLRRYSVDLHHVPLNAVPLLMPRPYVVTIHDMSSIVYERRAGWRNTFELYRFRQGLLQADRVIAVSEATQRDVEQVLGIPASRIRMIYSAPDPRFLAEPEGRNRGDHLRILERYGINYPFLLYVGNIRPQKNIPRLVEAFAVLRGDLESHPAYKDLRLIIIGDEISRYPQVRRAVIQTRVEQSVRFLGFVPIETLRVLYETAAAFVFPSLYEGFGLPPLEAMACGTPVVASNVSSLPEVVGDAAIGVNPENVFDIARGLREVLLDADLRSELRQRGFEQVKRFNWDWTARRVLETYKEVARDRDS